MIFLTLNGDHIDLKDADRIYTARRVIGGEKCWVIIVRIGGTRHPLVSTGSDKLQAQFHREALNQCQQNGTL